MAKSVNQWTSSYADAQVARNIATLTNMSVGPSDGGLKYASNDGSYTMNTIKTSTTNTNYGFVVVQLHSEITGADVLKQLRSSTWIFEGAGVSTSSAHGTIAGRWTLDLHHRDTHEPDEHYYSLHGARAASYWSMRGPVHNTANDPGFFYNTTDRQIACWFATFDYFRSGTEVGNGVIFNGSVTVLGTNDYNASGTGDESKNFFTDIYTAYTLPGTNSNWTTKTVTTIGRTTHGQGF